MTRTLSNTLSRRIALLCLALTPLAPMAAHAIDMDQRNPVDQLNRFISVERFKNLDGYGLYRYKMAVRQNETVKIGDYTPSQSKEMIENAPLPRD